MTKINNCYNDNETIKFSEVAEHMVGYNFYPDQINTIESYIGDYEDDDSDDFDDDDASQYVGDEVCNH